MGTTGMRQERSGSQKRNVLQDLRIRPEQVNVGNNVPHYGAMQIVSGPALGARYATADTHPVVRRAHASPIAAPRRTRRVTTP